MRCALCVLTIVMACRSEKGVTVFNSNPEAIITSHDMGNEVLEGTHVLFLGNVSDANHSSDELQVSWLYDSQTICGPEIPMEDGTTSCEIQMGMSPQVVLEVKDLDNARGSDTRTLVIVPSEPPTAEIVRPEPIGVFYSDQKVAIEGLVSDAEDNVLSLQVQWESDIDGVLSVASVPDSLGSVVGASYLSEGEHFILLQVEDSSGKVAFDDVTIHVGPPNSAPECAITSPQDGSSGGVGEQIALLGTANDVDVPTTVLQAVWSSSLDGELGAAVINSDGSILFPYSNLSSGTHVLTLSVTDERDATCTDSILYTVGTPPLVDVLSPAEGDIYNEGELISFVVSVADAQESPTDIDLLWTLNGSTYSTAGALSDGTATVQDSSLGAGSYSLQVVATDTEGLSDSVLRSFVVNGLPTAPQISLSPDPASTADDITVGMDVASTDPEGDPISYTYEWFQDGVSQGMGSSILSAVQTVAGQTWMVRVIPNDGFGNGAATEATIVISNSDPVLSSHMISPNTGVYNDTVLSCSATVFDADEILQPEYSWFVNGSFVESATSIDLSTYAISVGDTVLCRVSVEDSSGISAQSDVSVQIENRVPEMDSIVLTPTTAQTNTLLSVQATGSDADGESVGIVYDWYVNGSVVQSGVGDSLDGTIYFDKADTVWVRATPSDTHGTGVSQDSSSITIENSAPSSPIVAFLDTAGNEITGPCNTAEDIHCHVSLPASDADNDTLTYSFSWEKNGSSWTGSTQNNQYAADGISAADSATGDEWTCFVVADDGQDLSVAGSATIDIGAQFVWEEVGTETVEFAYGSCSSTASNTSTCSANLVGTKIYMHATEYMGPKRLQYKVLNQTNHHGSVMMDVAGARGYAVSISTDETQITWTGAVSCGADSIVSRTATVYECIEY